MKAGNIIYYIILALCVVLMVIGLIVGSRADAVDLEEPEKVGMLIIPAVLREYTEPELSSNLQVVSSKFDNERVIAEKLARWEKQRVESVESVETEPERIYLGRFKITGYCTCARCCGKSNGITASGTTATVGRTCAAAKGIPFGTVLYIDGIGERVVEDRGGFASNVIDVLCEDHPACYSITGWYDVWEVVEP